MQGSRKGTFAVTINSSEPGGETLRLAMDLFVEALNPFSIQNKEKFR